VQRLFGGSVEKLFDVCHRTNHDTTRLAQILPCAFLCCTPVRPSRVPATRTTSRDRWATVAVFIEPARAFANAVVTLDTTAIAELNINTSSPLDSSIKLVVEVNNKSRMYYLARVHAR
jgi:hypothetical protein